jgi:tetratricopeptide (TPR) repeat protein
VRGEHLLKAGHYREAIDELSAAISVDSIFPSAYNSRGFAYFMLRNYTRAITDFDKAIELKPGFKDALNNRAAAVKAAAR